MTRYKIHMDISTDLAEEKLIKWFQSIEKSGSVRINGKGLTIRAFGYDWKPGSLKGQVVDFLQSSNKPQSAAQVSRAIERNRVSVNRVLRDMENNSEAESYYDAKWKVRRYKCTDLAVKNVAEDRAAEEKAEVNGSLLLEYLLDGNTLDGELDFGIASQELDLSLTEVKHAARWMYSKGFFDREYVQGQPYYQVKDRG